MSSPRMILLSPGHGSDTPGKRSPKFEDGIQLKEWEFNRFLVRKIAEGLSEAGIRYMLLDTGATDVSLKGRVAVANTFGLNALYISIHGNASGNGTKWMKAKGWSIYTSKGQTKSDPIAQVFIEKAEEILPTVGMKVRKYSTKPNEGDYEENFYVLKNTLMPAVLTENGFYDNLEDCKIMMSEKGLEALAKVHVEAIKEILKRGL